MTGFNWDSSQAVTRKPRSAESSVEIKTYRIPSASNRVVLDSDHWSQVQGIRFGADDKAFFLGFCAALQLTDAQRYELLQEYVKRYRLALARAGDRQRSAGYANSTANTWLRGGAKGFISSE